VNKTVQIEYEPMHLRLASGIRLEKYSMHYHKDHHINNHFHETKEIILYHKFRGTVKANGRIYKPAPPFLLFFPGFSQHEIHITPCAYKAFLINFTQNYLNTIRYSQKLPSYPLIEHLPAPENNKLWYIFDWLHDLKNDPQKSNIKKDLFYLILDYVNHAATFNRQADQSKDQNYLKFTSLLSYLEKENLFDINVNKAAAICALSRSHFLALFKTTFKTTFHKFLLQRKITTAMHYLAETDMNINHISQRLGFYNAAHFSTSFKSRTGHSPRSFRSMAAARIYTHNNAGKI